MAQYIPHSIFHLARLLYVRPETFGPYYVGVTGVVFTDSMKFPFISLSYHTQLPQVDIPFVPL